MRPHESPRRYRDQVSTLVVHLDESERRRLHESYPAEPDWFGVERVVLRRDIVDSGWRVPAGTRCQVVSWSVGGVPMDFASDAWIITVALPWDGAPRRVRHLQLDDPRLLERAPGEPINPAMLDHQRRHPMETTATTDTATAPRQQLEHLALDIMDRAQTLKELAKQTEAAVAREATARTKLEELVQRLVQRAATAEREVVTTRAGLQRALDESRLGPLVLAAQAVLEGRAHPPGEWPQVDPLALEQLEHAVRAAR